MSASHAMGIARRVLGVARPIQPARELLTRKWLRRILVVISNQRHSETWFGNLVPTVHTSTTLADF